MYGSAVKVGVEQGFAHRSGVGRGMILQLLHFLPEAGALSARMMS